MILKNVLIQEIGIISESTGVRYSGDVLMKAAEEYNNKVDFGTLGYGEFKSRLRTWRIGAEEMLPQLSNILNIIERSKYINLEHVCIKTRNLRVTDAGLIGDIEILDNWHGKMLKRVLPDNYPEYTKLDKSSVVFAMRSVVDVSVSSRPDVNKCSIIAIDALVPTSEKQFDPVEFVRQSTSEESNKKMTTEQDVKPEVSQQLPKETLALISRLERLQEYVSSTEPWPCPDETLSSLPEVIKLLKEGELFNPEPHPDSGQGKWREMARMYVNTSDFYQGIITGIGEILGVEARTSDDGSVQDSVLALKVPEIVKRLKDASDTVAEKDKEIEQLKKQIDDLNEQLNSTLK